MTDMVEAIADKLLEDHMALMVENKKLKEQRDIAVAALITEQVYQQSNYGEVADHIEDALSQIEGEDRDN